MKLDAAWMAHPGTRALCAALEGAGHRALFVGGCVRNALLGAPVSDIDIATDATPEEVTACAGTAGLRAVPTGIAHGTITVIAQGKPHEVTSFRKDVETFGRHATVAFSRDIRDDAARRDFTMNALYAEPDGLVLDPNGTGLADLAARRLRFIGDAPARIAEDYLRILRFFRFHAWYADPQEGFDAEGLAACASLAEGLDSLSKERVGAEMTRLLAAPDPAPALACMAQAGILGRVVPGASARALPLLVDAEARTGTAPDAIRRLAALGGGDDLGDLLRLSRAEGRRLDVLRAGVANGADAAELGYRLGVGAARDVLLLRTALLEQPLDPAGPARAEAGAQARFPVSAADLMPDLEGEALGRRLAELEARWIASGFVLDRAALLA